ncbi:hypothetical protein PEC301645_23330 [Pectobacterium carotovorum subsp. carotovorum]|nr:hypothetical protein PEC301645_23330 [Pectobacterium carotovorum subsp. carotovorum]
MPHCLSKHTAVCHELPEHPFALEKLPCLYRFHTQNLTGPFAAC